MKIRKIISGYDIFGRFGVMIQLDRNSTDLAFDNAINIANHFNNIILYGDEAMHESMKNETVSFIKRIIKKCPHAKVIVYSSGIYMPVFLTNVEYIVYPIMKDYDIRCEKDMILPNIMEIYNNMNDTRFVFNVTKEKDMEEVKFICDEHNLSPNKIYISYYDDDMLGAIKKYTNIFAYNLLRDGNYNKNVGEDIK